MNYLWENTGKIIPNQPPEIDEGNREYKLKLTCNHKIHKIATQLRYRLYEGEGKAVYLIGVSDDGKSDGLDISQLSDSINYLIEACQILSKDSGDNIQIEKIRIYHGKTPNSFVSTIRIKGDLFS